MPITKTQTDEEKWIGDDTDSDTDSDSDTDTDSEDSGSEEDDMSIESEAGSEEESFAEISISESNEVSAVPEEFHVEEGLSGEIAVLENSNLTEEEFDVIEVEGIFRCEHQSCQNVIVFNIYCICFHCRNFFCGNHYPTEEHNCEFTHVMAVLSVPINER